MKSREIFVDAGRDPVLIASESVDGKDVGILTNVLVAEVPVEIEELREEPVAFVPRKEKPDESVSTSAMKRVKKTARRCIIVNETE